MYIRVCGTEEAYEDEATQTGKHTRYHIHVNGTYHCSVRYSQLLALHNKIKASYGSITPAFPPRRLLALSEAAIAERLAQLDAYLQAAASNNAIGLSGILSDLLADVQDESEQALNTGGGGDNSAHEETQLEIALMAEETVIVPCSRADNADVVLEVACKQLGMKEELTYYFALFLVTDDCSRVVRRLQTFERPIASLDRAGNGYRIQLRKGYANPVLEEKLLRDRVATKLVYAQAVHEFRCGQLASPADHMQHLEERKQAGDKLGFLKACRKAHGYNAEVVYGCTCDYPQTNTPASVLVAFDSLRIRTSEPQHEFVFPLGRIKNWEVNGTAEAPRIFSFDYLREGGRISTITINSDSAIHISMCLQGAVDEVIRRRQRVPIKTPAAASRERRKRLAQRTKATTNGSLMIERQTRVPPESSTQSMKDEQAQAKAGKRHSQQSALAQQDHFGLSQEDVFGDQDL